jgi:hypothetical protein
VKQRNNLKFIYIS